MVLDRNDLRALAKKVEDEASRLQFQVVNNLDERFKNASPAEKSELDKYVKRPLMLTVTSLRKNVKAPLEMAAEAPSESPVGEAKTNG